jgi:diaminopimelate dehydrogenase
MKRTRLAIVGYGRLGRACAEQVAQAQDLQLAGVVVEAGRAPENAARLTVAAHPRDLAQRPDAVLLCVPPAAATDVALDLLQQGMPLVECAAIEGRARDLHYDALGEAAHRHRVPAVVGAGWDPGVLPLLRRGFEILIPDGQTEARDRPGASLHHTEAARLVPGVADALSTELRDAAGAIRRYVYVELRKGADFDAVREAFMADPLFAGEPTEVFQVDSVAELDKASHGIVLERVGSARHGGHQNLLLEARFDPATFAARIMLDAVRRLERLAPGAHRYSFWP